MGRPHVLVGNTVLEKVCIPVNAARVLLCPGVRVPRKLSSRSTLGGDLRAGGEGV